MIGQLLSFSRSGPIQPKLLNLNSLLKELMSDLGLLIGADIQLVIEFGADLGDVELDPTQIEQVLLNLAANARDAMRPGGRLLIRTEKVTVKDGALAVGSKSGDYVLLEVSDNGAGMDKPTSQRIFEPFFTTKDEGLGTGLGLASVRGIVDQNGGYIRVTSSLGKGRSEEHTSELQSH